MLSSNSFKKKKLTRQGEIFKCSRHNDCNSAGSRNQEEKKRKNKINKWSNEDMGGKKNNWTNKGIYNGDVK